MTPISNPSPSYCSLAWMRQRSLPQRVFLMYTTAGIGFALLAALALPRLRTLAACNLLLVFVYVHVVKTLNADEFERISAPLGRRLATYVDFAAHALPVLLTLPWLARADPRRALPLALLPLLLVAAYSTLADVTWIYGLCDLASPTARWSVLLLYVAPLYVLALAAIFAARS